MVDILGKFNEKNEDMQEKERTQEKGIKNEEDTKINRIRLGRNKVILKKSKKTKVADRTGQTFRGITVIEELGYGKVLARCAICGEETVMDRDTVMFSRLTSCGCIHTEEQIGTVVNNLEIIRVVPRREYTYRCVKCNKEYTHTRKYDADKTIAVGCCIERGSIIGEVVSNFKVIEELNRLNVKVECTKCNSQRTVSKGNWRKGLSCYTCNNGDKTEQTEAVLHVTKDVGFGRVVGTCSVCNARGEYRRSDIDYNKEFKSNSCKRCKAKFTSIIE